jgi:N-acylglucosamine 2-epimerase
MNVERIKALKEFYHNTLLGDVVPFWEESDLIDLQYGGFISSVDREGKQYNTDKSVWFQGRSLWTFSKLCNTYGVKAEWLNAATKGAQFIREHCIDNKDGRMYFTVTREGKPLRKRRYFFSESFLVVGFAEYYLLSKNPDDLHLATKYFHLMYDIYL